VLQNKNINKTAIVLHSIDYTWFRAKVYFIDIRNMNCMTYTIHVPSINEVYIGHGTSMLNPGENSIINDCFPQ
jgi:hypothetical protein